jgi:Transglutaminase-like superfamily
MPPKEMALMLAAWVLMAVAAGALLVAPFRKLAPFLGKQIEGVAFIPFADDAQIERSRMVRRATLRAARVAPFRSDCLPQALVAATLCRLLGVPASVHLGVKLDDMTDKGPRAISAHAWVCSGREAVTGGRSFGAYTPVTCFLTSSFAAATRTKAG